MKSSFGIIPSPSSSSAPTVQQTLQEVLDTGRDLTNDNNYQGTNAGLGNTATNVNAFGTNSAKNNTGDYLNAFGSGAGQNNIGFSVNAFGEGAGYGNLGNYVNAFGSRTNKDSGSQYSNFFGYEAGYQNTSSPNNCFGYQAGYQSQGGYTNFFGYQAGYLNSGNAHDANAFGYQAGMSNDGFQINAFGYQALRNNTGNQVNAFGYLAGNGNTGSVVNAFGYQAGINNTYNFVNLFGKNATADGDKQLVFSTDSHNVRLNYNSLNFSGNTDFNIQPIVIGYENDNERWFSVNNTYAGISLFSSDYYAPNCGIYEVVESSLTNSFYLPNPALFEGQFLIVFNCDNANNLNFAGDYLPYAGGSKTVSYNTILPTYALILISSKGYWATTPYF